MKILAVLTHYKSPSGEKRLSSVDWWRVKNPLSQVSKNTDIDVKFVNKIVNKGDTEVEWNKAGKDNDIIYTSYMDTPKAYAYLRATCEANNAKHFMDLDDNLFEIPKTSPSYAHYKPGSPFLENAARIIKDVDYLSVSTPYLKEACKRFVGRRKETVVLPNYIDPEKYKYYPGKVKDNGKDIVIGYQGSSTHFDDIFKTGFIWGLRYVMNKYKNVKFAVIGCAMEEFYDYLPKDRVETLEGTRDHTQWIKLWQKLPFDIGDATLTRSNFNKGKSSIKYYEYALRKIPAVYAFTEPYIRVVQENRTGFLANDELEWGEKLSWLVENQILRRRMADKARKDVLKNYTIQSNWRKWNDYITNSS